MHEVRAKTLLTRWGGMNIYRGCTHGCVYCDSRSACYRFDHDFEDVGVKKNAPELLERTLARKRSKIMVGTGSMSDPYQPLEEELVLTRRCLEIIERYGHGATIITKSDRVLRDLDLLQRINERGKAVLQMTLTIADDDLSHILEPGVCPSSRRFEVLKVFQAAGIPTVVWLCPFLPWLTDTTENYIRLMDWCLDAGVVGIINFHIGMTLRQGNREYYYAALDRYFPGLSDLYRREYGDAYSVTSPNDSRLMEHFHKTCEAHGIIHDPEACFAYLREFPKQQLQLTLF